MASSHSTRRFAQARREQYVGTWLPEPVIEDITAEQKADLSFALLMTLERLNPLERAAFLLHDVFDVDYREIATVLKRTEAAVRQLVSRGRAHVQKVEPRYSVSREAELRLAGAFTLAAATGDAQTLAALLAEDAVMYVDGGGKVKVATHPIEGAGRIVRFITGVRDKRLPPTSVRPARVNGLPGLVIHTAEGAETLAVQCDGEKISAIYSVRNPDKLRHVLAGSARPGVDQLE